MYNGGSALASLRPSRVKRAATSAGILLVTSQALPTNFGTLLFEFPHATPRSFWVVSNPILQETLRKIKLLKEGYTILVFSDLTFNTSRGKTQIRLENERR